MHTKLIIKKVAVLGAGVMGAQIAAHLTNANISTYLFDLPSENTQSSAIALKAIEQLRKLDPAPLAIPQLADFITPANYAQDLEHLRECDLIIEAIAERVDLKQELFRKIIPYLSENTILATNTSGIPLKLLASVLPEKHKKYFCGIHFFNPPRYMPLVELIKSQDTDINILDKLETFLTTTLGKNVLRAKDTPNFIANRLGVFVLVTVLHHAQRLGIPFDTVDALTGTQLGRAKSATFRTMDIVGLDTVAQVIRGTYNALSHDPWQKYYTIPTWLEELLKKGVLGQKTQIGVYHKDDKLIKVLQPETGEYRTAETVLSPAVATLLKNPNWAARFTAWRASPLPEAQFLWAIHRDIAHYAAYWLENIADNARDIDFALRWGFGWQQGIFEIWQAVGWQEMTQWIQADIAAGQTMASVPLPAWVTEIEVPHLAEGSWSPAKKLFTPRSQLPVYKRQLYPELLLGEEAHEYGTTVFKNQDVRAWTRGDDVLILSFHSKMHTITQLVQTSIHQAIECAEREFAGMVIWQAEAPFSVGANLAEVSPAIIAGLFEDIDPAVTRFQQTSLRIRNAQVPVVAGVHGLALGGACEFLLHCTRVVAALESYIGLVEVGVGLLPAGGGCKEMARRVAQRAGETNLLPFLIPIFENMALGKVAKSAEEARQMGYLTEQDIIVFHPQEVLYVACQQVKNLAESGYRPKLPSKIKVAGTAGIANITAQLVNMLEGHFISEHDFLIASELAKVICGGEVTPNSLVDEWWILNLERKAFMKLLKTEKTLERMAYTLQQGKPLRN